MTLEEIINRPKMYRVNTDTKSPQLEGMNNMIGKEFECSFINFEDQIILLDTLWFNLSDVSELTPLKYEGKSIAIGDEVKFSGDWYTVYGYYWYDGRWSLNTVRDNDFRSGCYIIHSSNIEGHRTPQDNEPEEVTMSQVCEKFGKNVVIKKD